MQICQAQRGRHVTSGRPPIDEYAADEREHQLARLVGAGVAGEKEALVGPALHRPRLDHLAGKRNRIAGVDRLQPLELAEARRRPGAADRLAPRAHRLFLAYPVLHDEADANRPGVPARRDQAAEMRARCRGFVEMKWLRVEGLGKSLDLFRREGMAAERGLVADVDVLQKFHRALSRRPKKLTFSCVIIFSPAGLNSSKRKRTRPHSGRLPSGRVSRMVRRSVRRSPGRTGFSQRTSSMPGEPIESELVMKPSAIMRMPMAQVCHPDAASPRNMVVRAKSSSMCMGCGSNSAANAMISSRVTNRGPNSATLPTTKSSQ